MNAEQRTEQSKLFAGLLSGQLDGLTLEPETRELALQWLHEAEQSDPLDLPPTSSSSSSSSDVFGRPLDQPPSSSSSFSSVRSATSAQSTTERARLPAVRLVSIDCCCVRVLLVIFCFRILLIIFCSFFLCLLHGSSSFSFLLGAIVVCYVRRD